jgi:glycosyltransferase involved in cell wall biosynthesis
MNSSISIVVPVYNSARILPELARRIKTVMESTVSDFELILVNDGSHDNSWQVVEILSAQYSCVRGIDMMRNYGQYNALLCGIRAARYDVVVTMDDDLQHPPEEIPKLLAKLAEGFDVAYGAPEKLPHSWWRNIFSTVIKNLIARIMGAGTFRNVSSFRAFRTNLRNAFSSYENPDVFIDVMLSWGTTRFTSLPVKHALREIGSSNYSFWKLFNVAIQLITSFSTAPLRVASFVGFSFVFIGILIFLYVVIIYLFFGTLPGFPFIVSIISLFSGAQLFALGILGEYQAKMFLRSMKRPPYVVRESIGRHKGEAGD